MTEAVRSVLIVDDHAAVRAALCGMVAVHPELDVVGDAPDGAAGVAATVALEPDIVLLDVRMPVMDGLEATRRIRTLFPATRIVILSAYDDASIRRDALEHGADAFMIKGATAAQIHAVLLAPNEATALGSNCDAGQESP